MGGACEGGAVGDNFMVCPPLIVTRDDIAEIVGILGESLEVAGRRTRPAREWLTARWTPTLSIRPGRPDDIASRPRCRSSRWRAMSAARAMSLSRPDDLAAPRLRREAAFLDRDRRDRRRLCRHVPAFPDLLDLDGLSRRLRAGSLCRGRLSRKTCRRGAAAPCRAPVAGKGRRLSPAVGRHRQSRPRSASTSGSASAIPTTSRSRRSPATISSPSARADGPDRRGRSDESLLRRGTEAARPESLPVERRAAAQSGKAGAGRAAACRRARGRLRDRAPGQSRARPDRRRAHAGISRLPRRTSLCAGSASRARRRRSSPTSTRSRAAAPIPPRRSARPATTWPTRPARSRPTRSTAPAGAPGRRSRRPMRCWRARRRPMRSAARPATMPSPTSPAASASSTIPPSPPSICAGARPASPSSTSTCITATARRASSTPASDVLTVSLHADPVRFYPFFWGHADERGEGPGLGYNLQSAAAAQIRRRGLPRRRSRSALRRIRAFAPDALVVALGLDAFEGDPFRRPVGHDAGLRAHRRGDRRARPAHRHRAGGRLSLRRARRQSDVVPPASADVRRNRARRRTRSRSGRAPGR